MKGEIKASTEQKELDQNMAQKVLEDPDEESSSNSQQYEEQNSEFQDE